jgi:hypothetical protein
MFNLVIKWIKIKHKENKRLKYPTLLWDFLQKGGASQIHPHSKIYFYIILYEQINLIFFNIKVHLTLNENRYYSSFESIRYGAEGI